MNAANDFDPPALVDTWATGKKLEPIGAEIRNLSDAQRDRLMSFLPGELVRSEAMLNQIRLELYGLPLTDKTRPKRVDDCKRAANRVAVIVMALHNSFEAEVSVPDGVAQTLADYFATKESPCCFSVGAHAKFVPLPVPEFIGAMERFARHNAISDELKHRLHVLLEAIRQPHAPDEWRQCKDRLSTVLQGVVHIRIFPGEAWSDGALDELHALPEKSKQLWASFILHCCNATSSTPSKKWMKEAEAYVDQIGFNDFKSCVQRWFPLVDKPRTQRLTHDKGSRDPNLLIIEPHANLLRGLAWCCGLREDKELAQALGALALSAYRKVPQVGPRAPKVGNACLYALGTMPGLESIRQLATVKART